MTHRKQAFRVILCFVILAVQFPFASCFPAAEAVGSSWAGTWSTAPIPTGYYMNGARLQDFLLNSTVRTVIKTTVGGEKVRLKFSNRYGSRSMTITKTRIARTSKLSDTAIIEGTSLPVTFGGKASVSIPKGETVYSDPVDMHVESFEKLTISTYYSGFTYMSTGGLINAQSYIDPGDRTEALSAIASAPLTIVSGAITYNTTPFLCAVDAYGAGNSSIVLFGDSTLANDSPYYLAEKLYLSGVQNVGVLQEAIIGNELLHDRYGVTSVSHLFGDAGVDRFTPDVLEQAGVKAVFVKIGLNDVLHPRSKSMEGSSEVATVDDIINGYRRLIDMAHAKGLKIYFFGRQEWKGYARSFYGSDGEDLVWSQAAEDVLVSLNKWLQSGCPADGYISVDALKDPQDKTRIYPPYTSDGAHLTPLGAQVLVDLIPDSLLTSTGRLQSIQAYYASGNTDIQNFTPESKYTKITQTTAAPRQTQAPAPSSTAANPTPSASAAAPSATQAQQTAVPTTVIPSTTTVTITDPAGAEITEIVLVELPDDSSPYDDFNDGDDYVPVEIDDNAPDEDTGLPQAPSERMSGTTIAGVIIFAVLTTGVITFIVIYLMNKKNEED